MRRIWLALGTTVLLGVGTSGCVVVRPSEDPDPLPVPEPSPAEPLPPASPASPQARESGDAPATCEPTSTRLAYRGEEMADGSVQMTVGDVDAAPESPSAVRVFDYRAETSQECERVRIVKVSGWWCTTTVAPIEVDGEIVLGGAEPRARIGGEGFTTRCHGERPDRLRQVYQVERDSWSGWRDYGEPRYTSWTEARDQASAPVWEPCPQGRNGTYDYQLIVRIEIDGVRVGNSLATSAQIRTDCGTGVS